MGKLERLNKHIRSQHTMQVTITLAIRQTTEPTSPLVTKSYNNVKDIGVVGGGIYVLTNVDSLPIAHIPIGMVVAIECPQHDTAISIIPGKPRLELA